MAWWPTPGLAWAIRRLDSAVQPDLSWASLLPMLARYWANIARHVEGRHRSGRLKQWLNLLRRRHPEAQQAYEAVRLLDDPAQVAASLFGVPAAALQPPEGAQRGDAAAGRPMITSATPPSTAIDAISN